MGIQPLNTLSQLLVNQQQVLKRTQVQVLRPKHTPIVAIQSIRLKSLMLATMQYTILQMPTLYTY